MAKKPMHVCLLSLLAIVATYPAADDELDRLTTAGNSSDDEFSCDEFSYGEFFAGGLFGMVPSGGILAFETDGETARSFGKGLALWKLGKAYKSFENMQQIIRYRDRRSPE